MDLQRSIVDDESGVSPVIGVILMVAVTVIIAAVIGSTALGLGDSVSESPPQAQIGVEIIDHYPVEQEGGFTEEFKAVKLTHDGGDSISQDNIKVTVDGEPAHATAGPGTDNWYGESHPAMIKPWQFQDEITAGDETTLLSSGTYIEDNDITLDPMDEDRAIYTPSDSSGDRIIYLSDDPDDGADKQIDEGEGAMLEDDGKELRVVWESGDQSQTLLEEEIE